MATFTEASVKRSIIIQDGGTDPDYPGLRLIISATSYLANGTPVRSSSWNIAVTSLSAARQQGIADLMADAEAYAKQQFQIP